VARCTPVVRGKTFGAKQANLSLALKAFGRFMLFSLAVQNCTALSTEDMS
jgi:hypothetical protein